MKTVSIDRFEGTYAICEDKDGRFFAIAAAELPDGAREGSVLDIDDQTGTLALNQAETDRRRQKNARLQDEVFGH